jgi:hypothetical protein
MSYGQMAGWLHFWTEPIPPHLLPLIISSDAHVPLSRAPPAAAAAVAAVAVFVVLVNDARHA